jgi:D-alanyl-D-alanine carboxypeptidase/D-alanyl-D-alanine-endopeptidase (penicillin-binding protein 4)
MKLRASSLSPLCYSPWAAVPAQKVSRRKRQPSAGRPRWAKTIEASSPIPRSSHAHWGISVIATDGHSNLCAQRRPVLRTRVERQALYHRNCLRGLLAEQSFSRPRSSRSGTLDSDGAAPRRHRHRGQRRPLHLRTAWPYAGKTERPNPPLQALEDLADQIAERRPRPQGHRRRVIGDDSWFSSSATARAGRGTICSGNMARPSPR